MSVTDLDLQQKAGNEVVKKATKKVHRVLIYNHLPVAPRAAGPSLQQNLLLQVFGCIFCLSTLQSFPKAKHPAKKTKLAEQCWHLPVECLSQGLASRPH